MVIRVLVCDDSLFARTVISRVLEAEDDIKVCGQAKDGNQAVIQASELKPDVITMDVIMPRMSGYEATKEILAKQATPIVVLSSKSPKELKLSSDIMQLGAFDVVRKPTSGGTSVAQVWRKLLGTIRIAGAYATELREQGIDCFEIDPSEATFLKIDSQIQEQDPYLLSSRNREIMPTIRSSLHAVSLSASSSPSVSTLKEHHIDPFFVTRNLANADFGAFVNSSPSAIAIVGSTGATQTIGKILSELKSPSPPVFVVQHMPDGFTEAFAARLDRATELTVVEVTREMRVLPNHVYIAKSGTHLELSRMDTQIRARPSKKAKVRGHRPSADVTVNSMSEVYKPTYLCVVILSGMGHDGAEAATEVHMKGGLVLPQDAASSVVYGMARSFASKSAMDRTYTPEQITGLLSIISKPVSDRPIIDDDDGYDDHEEQDQ